jgi:general secretion pathway protein C
MRTKLLTFGVWLLVTGSLLFWGLKLFVPRPGVPAQAQLPAQHVALGADLHKLLGVSAVAAADDEEAPDDEADRFHLLGVVAPTGVAAARQGVALIAVGDQPARAWRTGAVVDGELVLLSVTRRGAQLGPRGGPPSTELSLPEPSPQAGGGMPLGAIQPRPGVPVPVPGQPLRPMGVGPLGMAQPQAGLVKPMPQGKAAAAADDEDEE